VDTFTTLWNRLLLRAPAVGAALSQDLIRDAFNQFAERREWSWLQKSSAFFPPTYTPTGSVTVTGDSQVVTGAGSNFTSFAIGAQIRVGGFGGTSFPTYTIVAIQSDTQLLMDKPWAGPNLAAQQYSVFQCYYPVPADFNYFYSIVNTTSNYRLWHNLSQAQLDRSDPQRVQIGITFAAAFYDYTQTFIGTINPTLQVHGSGPVPTSTSSTGFTFPADSIYTVEITTGGAPGGALAFEWKQDNGTYQTGVPVPDSNPINLSNGVAVYFPSGTYVLGDVFVIQCFQAPQSGVPRYELWPRPINTPYSYPFLYIAKWPDLTDASPALPDLIARRGDAILEMALRNCARNPGTDTSPNPYYDIGLANSYMVSAEKMIYELEVKDDALAMKDLVWDNYPFAPAPWLDGSWLQTHAIYPSP
jgi:hypothetical protein